ncbi:MAG: M23 family metallopeptidase [Treponema sp.]|nr:M23 family metallopeptidase [Candidatus Treponema merdequi]
MKKIKWNLSILLFSLFSSICFSQEIQIKDIPVITTKNSPEIPQLEAKDFLYRQYSEDLQYYYKQLASMKDVIPVFYSYTASEDDTIFSIAARCNIPYETIASLNQIAASDCRLTGMTLILPAAPGIFVPDPGKFKREKPLTSLEALIQKNCYEKLDDSKIICYNINERYFLHLPAERLDQTSRAFFLDVKMKPPLDYYWLSSDYGYRESPFGGEKQFHKGIDMAAPEGTKVYACKAGKVISTVKLDKTFGNYIILKHPNGLTSIYAHLSEIEVSNGENVATGQEIGLVGQTGKVTGPHLHFEIRQNGQPTDPNTYIKR